MVQIFMHKNKRYRNQFCWWNGDKLKISKNTLKNQTTLLKNINIYLYITIKTNIIEISFIDEMGINWKYLKIL